MPYDSSSVYNSYAAVPDDCECVVKGLISVKDSCGNTTGLLTPNDAALYQNSVLQPEIGYVKVFYPIDGGQFLGVMTIAEAQEYITYLNSLP